MLEGKKRKGVLRKYLLERNPYGGQKWILYILLSPLSKIVRKCLKCKKRCLKLLKNIRQF